MNKKRVSFKAMGSPCELLLLGEDSDLLQETSQQAVAEVQRLEAKYSRFLTHSILSNINDSHGCSEAIIVDAETASLLNYADTAFHHSDGLFDVTSCALSRIWNYKNQIIPTPSQIEQTLRSVGWLKVSWKQPELLLPEGFTLDLGGIVKEYASDAVVGLCLSQGVDSGFVNLGGDIAVIGPPVDSEGWPIGISHPLSPKQAMASVLLKGDALATSGDYERYFEINGKHYSHIINPLTGYPSTELCSVSVIASHCVVAGTAATIAMLKGRDGIEWLHSLGVKFIAIDRKGVVSSNGLGG